MSTPLLRTITFLAVLSVLGIVGGCNLMGGNQDSRERINWRNGEIIDSGNEADLSQSQRTNYRLDAERLAIRIVRNQDSTQTEIPQTLIDLIYNGLVHIATVDISKAEEVVEEYDIHTRFPAHPRQIEVWTDTTAFWVEAWKNGQSETGDAHVDDLMSDHNLVLNTYEALEDSVLSRAILESDNAINVFAVGNLFEEVNKVKDAGPQPITDGNEINVLIYNDRVRYFFARRFDDCSSNSGCSKSHIWAFDVFKNGEVTFLAEQDD